MRFVRRIWLPGAALVALMAGAVAVQAATPSPSSKRPAQIFIDKLAGILHVSSNQAQSDLKQAELQTIDQLLKDGRITQAQADAMKQRVQSGNFPGWGFPSGGLKHGARLPGTLAQDLRKAELDAAAKALHLSSSSDLMTQLKSGKSLSDLEQSAGVTDATLRDALKNAAKTVLDKAVKAGTITQAQEDAMLKRIQDAPLGIGPFHRPWHGFTRGPRPGGPPPGPDM